MIRYIWEFPMTLLSWIVFHLLVLTDGKVEWVNSLASWTDITLDTFEELEEELNKEDDPE